MRILLADADHLLGYQLLDRACHLDPPTEEMTTSFMGLLAAAGEVLLGAVGKPSTDLAAAERKALRAELRESDQVFDDSCRGLYNLLGALAIAYPALAPRFERALEVILGGNLKVAPQTFANRDWQETLGIGAVSDPGLAEGAER